LNAPRFVELIRVSTAGQDARDTPELQRRALDAMRTRLPGVLVRRLESTISGATAIADRPDLQELAALSAARAFDEVRVYAVDRLTRAEDPRARFALWGMVADAGARILDTNGKTLDPADPSNMGEVDFYLSTLFAAQERKRIIRRTSDGRKRAASMGRLPHGETPFGLRFDKITGRWSVEEGEAALYRRTFDLYLSGQTLRGVADTFRREGIPTRHGGTWRACNIHRLLRNRAAIGEFTALDTVIKVPAIVAPELFDAAQARMRCNKENSGTLPTYPALFRRAVVCGECGHSVRVAVKWRDAAHTSRKAYYCCASGDDDTIQPKHFLYCHRVEDFDAAVRAELERILADPKLLTDTAKALTGKPRRDTAKELAAAQREAKRLEAAEGKTLALLGEDGISQDSLKARLKELAAQRAEVARQIAALETAAQGAPVVDLKDMRAGAARVLKTIKGLSAERWGQVARVLFPGKLKVWPDAVTGECVLPLDGLVSSVSQASRAARTRRSS
jgi:DNA invertase Pin-like site-specific DNA recombinase